MQCSQSLTFIKRIHMRILFYLALLLLPIILVGQQAEDQLFTSVEEMPQFPGCDNADCSQQKLLEYVYGNLKYPSAAKENKTQGMVVIQFVIGKDGSIRDAKIVRDIGSGCGDAALHVVNSMADLVERDTITTFDDVNYIETVKVKTRPLKWTPGLQYGKAVDVLYTLPVRYKLADDALNDDQELEQDVIQEVGHEEVLEEDNTKDKWITFPPEYSSFQTYKDQVLVPEQISLAFKVDPVESSKVVGDIIPYGQAMHPLLKKMGAHNGVDFRAVPGVPVRATADGTIRSIEINHTKYGQSIQVTHNDKTFSLYAHLSAIDVAVGQSVKAGEQIGAVGQSGTASYPHLHYELHINGQTENPILDTRNSKNMHASETVHLERSQVVEKPKPLLVIDGAIQNSDFAIEYLDPNDIESMHVLKGESAFNKYGDRGANGVVEIIRKDNKVGSEIKKELDSTNQFELAQNVPNPVLDQTKISFHLPSSRPASLLFYNQSGEFVYGIKDGLTKGYNEVNVSVSDLNQNGLVYYFLIQDQMTKVKKMVVVQ